MFMVRIFVSIGIAIAGFSGVVAQDNASPLARLKEAIDLKAAGDEEKANAIVAELARDDKPGLDKAHYLRASQIAGEVAKSSNPKSLATLRWHLEHCSDQQSEEISKLWAVYFVTGGQPEQAVPYLERATLLNPRLHLSLANLYAEIGNKAAESRALQQAEKQLSRLLAEDPLSIRDRLQLAVTLVRRNRFDEAENTILEGVKLHNNDEMRRAAAQYFLLLCDIKRNEFPKDYESQVSLLERAFKFDLGLQQVYERIIELHAEITGTDFGHKTESSFATSLSDGQIVQAMFFVMSRVNMSKELVDKLNTCLVAGSKKDSGVAVAINNLSWMMLHQERPNIDAALSLSETALKLSPNKPSFRDTLGTIYMRQGKYEKAIMEFESILPRVENQGEIHRKLAEIYDKTGKSELARSHREKAEAAK